MKQAFFAVLACLFVGGRLALAFVASPLPSIRHVSTKIIPSSGDVQTSHPSRSSDSFVELNMIGRLLRRRSKQKQVETLERDDTKKKKEPEQLWRVMLYNTESIPDRVARIIVRVIPILNRAVAFELVLRARDMGKVPLIITQRKEAEIYCLRLQRAGLPVTIEPHDVER